MANKINNLSKIYVSFSGGKDSTVLLHLVRRLYPNTPAVFVDTGLEYPELREFVKTIENIIWLRPEMNFKKVIEKYGYPVISKEQSAFIQEYRDTNSEKLKDIRWNGNKWGRGKISLKWRFMVDAPFRISDKCCDIMKKKSAHKYEKENAMNPIIGTMTEESVQRKSNWLMYGCNMFETKRPLSKPLSFWTEQDILAYINKYNLSYASVYGEILQDNNGKYYTTQCKRTGCTFCMFGINQEIQRFANLFSIEPKIYDYAMRGGCFDEKGVWKPDNKGLGIWFVLEWLNVHGNMKIEIPNREYYINTYGNELTKKWLKGISNK